MYSEKDFFGDPSWPTEQESQKNKVNQPTEQQMIFTNKPPMIQERQQNLMSPQGLPHCHDESYDLQRTFFLSEHKMQYSNQKHSEVTYLDDFHKQHIFFDDEHKSENLSEKRDKQIFELDMKDILVKYQEEPFSEDHSNHISSNDNYLPDELLSTINNYITQKQKKQSKKKANRRSIQKGKKTKNCHQIFRRQNSIVDQLIDKNCLMHDRYKKQKMRKIENQIMKKLKHQQETESKNQDIYDKTMKNGIKNSKLPKYKIMTQSQKQYLVFLSTISTTCEVARRFNISVNNICRWKKGCARKVGAGRKITNQQLEQKVIQYVKDLVNSGQSLTRKKVQIKAKQLSENENFKASKGWFQRFYTRNINIFPPQQMVKQEDQE